MASKRRMRGLWLGRRAYAPVYALQEALRERRAAGRVEDTVLLVEHEPVVTFGRRAEPSHLLVPRGILASRGVEVVETDRGGDVTLHAPGQLVAYPIIDLKPDRCDVRRYVRDLTEAMRRLAAKHGIASGPVEGYVGLWVDGARPAEWSGPDSATRLAKIGAVGVRISRWVTMHGFALNLTTDLDLFDLIVPCGISQHGVASVASLTGRRPDVRTEAERALTELADLWGMCAELDDWSGQGALSSLA